MNQALNAQVFNELVLAIYAAAEDPGGWMAVFTRLREITDSSAAGIVNHDRASREQTINVGVGFSDETLQIYEEYYQAVAPWSRRLPSGALVPGRTFDGRETISETEFRKTEYYNDFGRRHGSVHCLAAFIDVGGPMIGTLGLNRTDAQDPFEPEVLELLVRLIPHVQRALRIHRKLEAIDDARRVACEALSRLAMGVVLLDHRGVAIFANPEARRLETSVGAIQLSAAGLRGATVDDTRRLRAAVGDVLALKDGREIDGRHMTVQLSRPGGGSQIIAYALPAGQAAVTLGAEVRAAAALFLVDPDRETPDLPNRMITTFGLTPAEARIGSLLIDGIDSREIAQRLEVSRETVRWHLKHVLHKTRSRTQAEFVSRVLRSLPDTI
jgi:DNA-binding CsgD family transcriptional regulator